MRSSRLLLAPLAALMFGVLSAALSACHAVDGNPPTEAPKKKELRELILRGAAPEDRGGDLLGAAPFSQRDTLDRIADIAKQPNVTGLFLQVGELGGSWARSGELRDALLAVHDAKKPVHCYFENTDNVGYALLARVCDRITITPTGLLSLVGVHAEVLYARDLLEMLGLRAEMLQVGRFKGAADPLTRSDMPVEVQQTMNALMDDLQADITQAVMQGRKLSEPELRALIDRGPLTSELALQAHLVDSIAFDDQARAEAKAAAGAEQINRLPERETGDHKGFFDLMKAVFGSDDADKQKNERIALAYLEGTIDDGEEDGQSGASAGPFIRAMHRFADDDKVKAVVLRIHSPGGSALASDRMWHAVRRVVKRKPVIVSISDMAASGGYYVACAGSEIFADDTSLVGSIGVVGGKIAVTELANKLGVKSVELSRGKNASWTSPLHMFSDSERAAIQHALETTYGTFLSRVAEGRHLKGQALDAVAEGRIMSGRRAREGGLVDTRGGLVDALARARTKAGLSADSAVEVWPEPHNLFERITKLASGGDARAAVRSAGASVVLGPLADSPLLTSLMNGPGLVAPVAALPYVIELH